MKAVGSVSSGEDGDVAGSLRSETSLGFRVQGWGGGGGGFEGALMRRNSWKRVL